MAHNLEKIMETGSHITEMTELVARNLNLIINLINVLTDVK